MAEGYFGSEVITIICKLALALICGGILGIERERKLRPAGLRTYMLVCIGATLVMMTNEFIYLRFPGQDVARMGAQVISGIGFLGAGTIIVTKSSRVRGLTTAAGLWTAACVGLAIGIGYYSAAIICEIIILAIMVLFENVDKKIEKYSKIINLYIEFNSAHNIRTLLEYATKKEIRTSEMQMLRTAIENDESVAISITLECENMINHQNVIREIAELQGIQYVKDV